MSVISNLIFKNAAHKMSSPYGPRKVINTSAGATSSFHNGTDYSTDSKKLAQYAIESGTILSCGKAADGANYIWVKYPRINKKFLHYHLNDICVVKGQKVEKGTLLGHTGKTGKATGIHLHLGIKDLTSDSYIDPEVYAKTYSEASTVTTKSANNSFFPSKGYWGRGDVNAKVGQIASFMYKTFWAYTPKAALGNIFGPNLEGAVMEFQRREKIQVDGKVGPDTLKHLKNYGFEE